MLMVVVEFFIWWYGSGWLKAFSRSLLWSHKMWQTFSVGILLKTLFSPWKRIVTLPGKSVDDKIRAFIDNLVSRFVGLFIRIAVIVIAIVLTVITTFFGVLLAILWPILPIISIYCLLRFFTG